MKNIKVVIVDDSVLLQKVLGKILNSDPEIIVVGTAENPIIARQIIKVLNPDVLILDVEMPEMDGITFLEKLMRLRPMPVILCSSFTPHCRETTLEAFRLGVVDIISKPILNYTHEQIIEKVKNAAAINIKECKIKENTAIPKLSFKRSQNANHEYVFAIGASTGGTEALNLLFKALPNNLPPIVVTQHLPEGFVSIFAERANQQSALKIAEAKDGDLLKSGHVYIAPGGKYMEIETKNKQLVIRLSQTEREDDCGHKPSVDVMMQSLAQSAGKNAIGILLTGMGSDGAKGMLALKDAGAMTIAQDENTSVIWGMPKVAIDLGAVTHILPLQQIPGMMLQCISTQRN